MIRKVKVSELIGPALDFAVARCQGEPIVFDPMNFGIKPPGGYWIWNDKDPITKAPRYMQIGSTYSPSTKWEQAGPIIELECIGIWWDGAWHAKYDGCEPSEVQDDCKSPLVVAMRCLVASYLGAEVEIPEELLV